jgi:hypothetical protein
MMYAYEARAPGEVTLTEGTEVKIIEPDGTYKLVIKSANANALQIKVGPKFKQVLERRALSLLLILRSCRQPPLRLKNGRPQYTPIQVLL